MTPELLKSFLTYSNICYDNEGSEIIDLTDHGFFYPTSLLPILSFIKKNSLKAVLQPNVHGYVSTIINPSKSTTKSYLPFRELRPHNTTARAEAVEDFCKLINYSYGGMPAVDYLVYELTDNIYRHSDFEQAFIMAQTYPTKNFTEICFFDDGISIPGNFSRCGLKFEDDADAIQKALEGTSTQGEFNHRGWSLNDILNMFTKDSNGELFIASREGAIYLSNVESNLYPLKDKYRIDGTLVSIRIPKVNIDIKPYIR